MNNPRHDQRVMLINMPWSSLYRPSIQLGTLQGVLDRAGIAAQVRSFNLAFMEFLISREVVPGEEERFSVSDYLGISEEFCLVGLGDWIFAVPPFSDEDEALNKEYAEYLRAAGCEEQLLAKVIRIRQLAPAFLESCVADVLAAAPRVVGFTTTFSQNVPSLVLAKLLKTRAPNLQVVFGGGNCDGPMGDALHRSFPWVDVVVRGEAERVLPALLTDLFAGRKIRPQPGLCYREMKCRIGIEQRGGDIPMDEVPMPIYDEYFERLRQSSFASQIMPHLTVPFESARGCWWGAKQHCTFCGLNGSSMTFRSKSPDRVLEELLTLAQKHERLDFQAVDNIIAMPYFRDFLPKLREAACDFKLFYETKANLKKEQVRALREAGVVYLQPGLESLSTPILKLMKKGVTALQNIRLLKWCSEFGIEAAWNMLYAFPGESPEEYDRMTELIPSLTHLRPPIHLCALVMERFSPYHQRPHEFGLKVTGPKECYRLIYPCDEATLNDLAYTFDYSYEDGREPEKYAAAFKERVHQWQAQFEAGSSLSYRRGPGFLLINDRRPGLGGYDYTLAETETKIYPACDAGATPLAVWSSLQVDGQTDISLEDVEDFLDEMNDLKLMYEEDGVYLSLAVPTNPRMESVAVESRDAPSKSSFVELSRQVIEEIPVTA